MTTEKLLRDTLHAAANTIEAPPPEPSTLRSVPVKNQSSRRRRTITLAAAAVLLTATAAGAAGQLWEFDLEVFSEPEGDQVGLIYNSDLFARGAPFHCTAIFDMTPSQAAALVRDLGFDVSWQYDVPGWPIDKKPPDDAYIDAVVMMDETTARLIATPDRRPVRPDRGCPK